MDYTIDTHESEVFGSHRRGFPWARTGRVCHNAPGARHSRTIIPKLDTLPTSAVNSGTQGDRTRCPWGPLAHQGWEQGGVTMQHELHWLDYDPVAVAVLAIGMGLIELFALLF